MFELCYNDLSKEDFLNYVKNLDYKLERKPKKHTVISLPCAFDIETTSTYIEDNKVAFCYLWSFGVNGRVVLGRTLEDFKLLLNELNELLNFSILKRLIIYVHNLAFEFQFIRHLFEWETIFSLDKREPLYCLTKSGIEFRCSYKLSNYSLAKLSDNLQRYQVKKLVGDLDYDKVRHSNTPLTKEELQYSINDVLIVMAYIQENIENEKGIINIPLTSTGFVRNFCKRNCIGKSRGRSNYNKLMSFMSLTLDEYKQLKRAFAGGFTHANAYRVGKYLKNVESCDFTSSYPFVMVSEQFPMSKAEYIESSSQEEYEMLNFSNSTVADFEFIELENTFLFENIISYSKCWKQFTEAPLLNNGRVVTAKRLKITLTDVDYQCIKQFYKWKEVNITNIKAYEKGYLPLPLIKSILKLYSDKTQLKGVENKEVEYLKSKGMLNSVYGMCVTDIVRDEIIYDAIIGWEKLKADGLTELEVYNNSKTRFLSYQWGVWTTAYARRNLYTGILEFQQDYIYSDTDSLKGVNFSKHQKYFDNYNERCKKKLEKTAKTFDLDFDLFAPKTIKGKVKMLGVWDYEGCYDEFKTLGAKRYIWSKKATDDDLLYNNRNCLNGKLFNLTVSGVNKNTAMSYLLNQYGLDIVKKFDFDFYVPADYTGKLTHTYIDEPQSGYISDYLGDTSKFESLSGVHLEKASYEINENTDFRDFLYSLLRY